MRVKNCPRTIYLQLLRIDNRLVIKIRDGHKLELQTPETMKLFGSPKKLFCRTKSKKIFNVTHQNSIQQIWKKKIWYRYKNRTRCNKTAFKKVIHKAAEARGEFRGNKIAGKTVKPNPMSDMNSRNVEEILYWFYLILYWKSNKNIQYYD